MDFWLKLAVDWLCIMGSWLRARVTFRRVVYVAAFAVAVMALGQFLTLDLALLMAGDVAFYCEIASAVMLIVARGHIRHYAQMAKFVLQRGMRRVAIRYRRGIGARRRRGMRKPSSTRADSDDGAAVYAMMAA